MKFILHLQDESTKNILELAFLDARRLGRIRLCTLPLKEPPISALGFDPLLSMPSTADFTKAVVKRTCPVKALLLDQSFSAGVGNWVADEILYHARVHPEQRCNTLSPPQLDALHFQMSEVCRIAVDANADDSKFPDDWLFKHRWGKGKKQKHTMTLPDGSPATIKWITVGGRTSAYVAELQKVPSNGSPSVSVQDDGESDLTPSPEDLEVVSVVTQKQKGGKVTKKRKADTEEELPRRKSKRKLVRTAQAAPEEYELESM